MPSSRFRSWVAAGVAVVLLGVLVYVALPARPAPTFAWRVVERYEFAETAPGAAVALSVAVPRTGPYQKVSEPTIGWNGAVERTPDGRTCVLRLTGASGADGRAVAVIAYDLSVTTGVARWPGSVDAGDLVPSRFVESDQPAIRRKAAELVSGMSREDAFRIFCFVSRHVHWQPLRRHDRDGMEVWSGGEDSALRTLETGGGGCGEFANLTVALLRAAGIPARPVGGLALPSMAPGESRSTEWTHPAGSHAWVEFYVEGAWELADSSWVSDDKTDEGRRRWFGRNDGSHLAYGGTEETLARYRNMVAWAQSRGQTVAAICGPVYVAAAVSGGKGGCTPSVTLTRLPSAR